MPTPEFIRALRAKIGNDLLHLPVVAVLAYDNAGRPLLVQDIESQLWVCPGGIVAQPGAYFAPATWRPEQGAS